MSTRVKHRLINLAVIAVIIAMWFMVPIQARAASAGAAASVCGAELARVNVLKNYLVGRASAVLNNFLIIETED